MHEEEIKAMIHNLKVALEEYKVHNYGVIKDILEDTIKRLEQLK